MHLKSSKKSSLPFLLTLLVLAALLFFLGDNKKADKFLETPEFDQKTNLDFIQLTFSEKAFKKIKKKRLKALSAGILETSDRAPSVFRAPGSVLFQGCCRTDFQITT